MLGLNVIILFSNIRLDNMFPPDDLCFGSDAEHGQYVSSWWSLAWFRRWTRILLLYVINFYVFIFNNLNVIITDYSSLNSGCVPDETLNVAVNTTLYKFCL